MSKAEEALRAGIQFILDEEPVASDQRFVDDLGADSLDVVEIILYVEESLAIEIPDEDAEKLKTVQEAIDYLEDKVGKD